MFERKGQNFSPKSSEILALPSNRKKELSVTSSCRAIALGQTNCGSTEEKSGLLKKYPENLGFIRYW